MELHTTVSRFSEGDINVTFPAIEQGYINQQPGCSCKCDKLSTQHSLDEKQPSTNTAHSLGECSAYHAPSPY